MTSPEFTLRFSPTPRGARLARRLASQQMDAWAWPYGTPTHDAVEMVVAELASNAVTHGRVPGRDAELRLMADRAAGLVRIEVSDARGERYPWPEPAAPLADSGRGLLLVATLADAWGVTERLGGPGKTVWATVSTRTPGVASNSASPVWSIPACPAESADSRGGGDAGEARTPSTARRPGAGAPGLAGEPVAQWAWPWPAAAGSSSSFFSTTRVSVVRRREAMEAAFSRAERVTFTGSMTPALTRSPYSPVAAL